MDKHEVCAFLALTVIQSPNPAALVNQDFRLSVENKVGEGCAASSCDFCCSLFCNECPAFHQIIDHLRPRARNNFGTASVLFLFNGSFCETRERYEIAHNLSLVIVFGIKHTHELVEVGTANRFHCGYTFGDGSLRLETVVSCEIQFTSGLVNVEARLFVTVGNKEVSHEPSEKIAAPIVVGFKDADGGRLLHSG